LIISEATPISPMAHGYPLLPGIYTDAQIDGWKKITDAVHAKGGKIVLQLWHVGRISHPSLLPNNALPVAPSAIKPEGKAFTYNGLVDYVEPRALEASELPGIIADYAHATQSALTAGFDGVEVHAANGYLLDQFLRDGSNRRSGPYGGSIANRARLLLEVLAAVRRSCPVVGLRLSPLNSFNAMVDSDPLGLACWLAEHLNDQGLAYLHVMRADMAGVQTGELLGPIRQRFGGVLVANMGYDAPEAAAAVAAGAVDAVAFGRAFIANPDLPERIARGASLASPNPDCFYTPGSEGYSDYPPLQG